MKLNIFFVFLESYQVHSWAYAKTMTKKAVSTKLSRRATKLKVAGQEQNKLLKKINNGFGEAERIHEVIPHFARGEGME